MGGSKTRFTLLKYLGISALIFIVGFVYEKIDMPTHGYRMIDLLTLFFWALFSAIYYILWLTEPKKIIKLLSR